MKKIQAGNMLVLFLLVFLFLFAGFKPAVLPLPNDNKETRKVQPFTKLKVYGRFDVVLMQGEKESVTLESDNGKLEKRANRSR